MRKLFLLGLSLFLMACSHNTAMQTIKSETQTQSEAGTQTETQMKMESEKSAEKQVVTSMATTERTDRKNESSVKESKQETQAVATGVSRVIDVPTTSRYKIVVNKKNPLSSTYNPGEDVTAKNAFVTLQNDMRKQGFAISQQYSGFRSYDRQKQLYQNYVARDGKAKADTYSARSGYSEHQTGLTFDMIDTSGALVGTGIQDGSAAWLAQNTHRYGFVIRYPKGKEHITGYMAEPWHLRFIGNDATAIYQSGKTLEEFYGVIGGGYVD